MASEYANIRCLTNPLHRIAARLRFGVNVRVPAWAANGDWARSGIIEEDDTMSIILLACTKDGVSIVHTTGTKKDFSVLFHTRIAIVPGDWISLVKSLESVLKSRIAVQKPSIFVTVKAATGQYAASAETFKAEGFAEYVIATLGIRPVIATKQSLPKALSCEKTEKWQAKAKQLFNSQNTIKGFQEGYDAAVCRGLWEGYMRALPDKYSNGRTWGLDLD